MTDHQSHPLYAKGYWDALEGEPLFDDASEAYAAGWRAASESKQILLDAGFGQTSPSTFSKRTVIAPRA